MKWGLNMQIMNLLISSIIQTLLFTSIPFVWWVVTARKDSSFFHWIGIKKLIITNKKVYTLSIFFTIILFLSMVVITPLLVDSSETATAQFYGQGLSAVIPILIYSFIQTSLSEEVFFRGFLTKRLANKFGFRTGNVIQGLAFGLMHGIIFISTTGFFRALIITLITALIGGFLGWINEKQSGGSIVSGWLLHGLSNVVAAGITLL